MDFFLTFFVTGKSCLTGNRVFVLLPMALVWLSWKNSPMEYDRCWWGLSTFLFFFACSPYSRGQKSQKPGVLRINRSGLIVSLLSPAKKSATHSSVHCLPSCKISEYLACVGFSARRLEDEHDWARLWAITCAKLGAHTVHGFLVKLRAAPDISGVLTRHKLIWVTLVWYLQPKLSRSSMTSRFDFSIRLLAQCTVYRHEDFTVDALAYDLFDYQISRPQVRYTGVENSSTDRKSVV